MLFNSYTFLCLFLPVTLLGFFYLGRSSRKLAAAWLMAASLFFYGWWNPAYLGLLLGSIVFNYVFGIWIAAAVARAEGTKARNLAIIAIAGDLILLGYYKYANFFLDNVNHLAGSHFHGGEIILPLGISFFTFTQIAFLADTYQGKVREYDFVHYGLFVTYFPHLIAGPVLHHKEMMPQFSRPATYRPEAENLAVGFTIFIIGLFKKVILADGISVYVAPVFSASSAGVGLGFLEAWCGALAFSLQLYFDFSGYSDMAIGISRMFGVRLPLNFHSPYKAVNIIDFWRRWHMTLSRFLRDYLYIPLGGNRLGRSRRYLNLLATMLLGGLWHGAGWTYIAWGALHGAYLVANHGWHALRRHLLGQDAVRSTIAGRIAGRLLTFLAVVVAWVFFRADSVATAVSMLKGMAGLNGLLLPDVWLPKWGALGQWLAARGVRFGDVHDLVGGGEINWIWILLAIAWLAPNTQQIMAGFRPALDVPPCEPARRLGWRPTWRAAWVMATLFFIAVINLNKQSAFLYFQF